MDELQPYQRELLAKLEAANGKPLVLMVPRIRRVVDLTSVRHRLASSPKTDTSSSNPSQAEVPAETATEN